MLKTYKNRFRLELDPEFIVNGLLNLIFKGNDLGSRRSAAIDDRERVI